MVNSYLMTTTGKEDPRFEDLYLFHGKSAYQAAVEQGFTGTEVEWIASLMNVEFNEKAKFQYKNQWLLYVATDLNHIYRYNAETNEYIQVGVPLGETNITAYRGDRGKIAYDHSQSDHDYLHRNGGTMNGDINTMNLIPKTDKLYDLGSMNKTYVNTYTRTLQIRDGGGGTTYGRIVFKTNTENSDGYGYTSLVLGTNKATGAGNAYGFIDIYGKNTGYTRLLPSYDGTTQINLNFPKESGTIARIEDNVASATILKTTRTFYISDYSTANTGPGSEFNGSSNCTIKLPDTINATKFVCTTLEATTGTIGTANITTLNVSGNSVLKGTLSVTGASTFAGTVTITKTTDLSGTANNSPALILGGAVTAAHLELDADEIQAKTNGTSVAALYLNKDGGTVNIGSDGLSMNGVINSMNITPLTDITYNLGGTDKSYKNVYGQALQIYSGSKRYGQLYMATAGTADTVGEGRLTLGNSTASGTAGNAYGRIQMYGTSSGYTIIKPGYNSTSNITLNLPSKGGTIARIEDNVASATILETSRNFYVSDYSGTNTGAASGFNGSDNCTIKLPNTIKAATFVGNLTGNADSATILQTTRKINNTDFNGSDNITTAIWGTARDFTIGLTKKSVNGSQAMTWTLNEIGAVEVAGDTMTGPLIMKNSSSDVYMTLLMNGTIEETVTGTGGWARGIHYAYSDGTELGGLGLYGNGKTVNYAYLGPYATPWASVTPAGLLTTTTVKATTGNITTVDATTVKATNATMTGTTTTVTLTVSGNATVNGKIKTATFEATSNASIAGTLNVTGASTFAGTVTITKTTDLSGTANNSPALILGGAVTAAHLELDANEIQAKTNGTSVAPLYINNDGGAVTIGSGGLTVSGALTVTGNSTFTGNILANADIASDIGATGKAFKNIYGQNHRVYSGGYSYGMLYMATAGTASANGEGRLTLGNSTASGNAGNAYGRILMYGTSSGYTLITPGNNGTGNITITLPSGGGTLARTSDNVASASKLNPGATINGKQFDGTVPITTVYWGEKRSITIKDSAGTHSTTTKDVDGSANITLTLPDIIKATTFDGNATTATRWKNSLTLNITGDMTGTAMFDGDEGTINLATTKNHNHDSEYLNVSGDKMLGNLTIATTKHILAEINNSSNIGSSTSKFANVYATTFHGNLSGNANTATKLYSATVGDAVQPVYFLSGNPTKCTYGLGASVNHAAITTGFNTAFRTKIMGSGSGNIQFIAPIRSESVVPSYATAYSAGLSWGMYDTFAYIMPNYSSAQCFIGGGNGDKLNWVKEISFTDHNHSGVYVPLSGNSTINGTITVTGTLTATKVYNAVWNDYAEWYEREDLDEYFEAGDIVTWHECGVKKTTKSMDNLVVGVYSDTYGHIIGGEALDDMEDNIEKYIPVGVSGRVNVKVIGTVNRGDLIVSSDIPGIGIAIPSNLPHGGCVVGKALQNKESDGLGKIKIQIMLA